METAIEKKVEFMNDNDIKDLNVENMPEEIQDIDSDIDPEYIKQSDNFSYKNDIEDSKVFKDIDRDEEDKNVLEYQKTGDNALLEKIYKIRIPTIQIWSRRYKYLVDDSMADMFGEFQVCFYKAVSTYDGKRSSFNTCLFTYFINHVKNLCTSRRAKKRLPEGMNPNSISNFMLSLDYKYGGKDGSESTIAEVLSNKMSDKKEVVEDICFNETIKILSNGNEIIYGFMKKIGDGSTLASLIKEYKTIKGNVAINNVQYKKINGKRKRNKDVAEIIKNNANINDKFVVLEYTIIDPNNLEYIIEMKKSKETDLILKTIRKIRRDKKHYMAKI